MKTLLMCLVLSVVLLAASSCSWRIFSEGEIHDNPDLVTEPMSREAETTITIDSLGSNEYLVTKFTSIQMDTDLLELVEMEVGELLEKSELTHPDTILVDLRP